MFQNTATSVAEYIDGLPEDRQPVVRKLRSLVKKHLPKGFVEQIGWGAITYAVPLKALPDTYNGQPLCYVAIAAQKHYYSLYLMSVYGDPAQMKQMTEAFAKRGKKLDMGKACLRFKSLDDLPLDVVADVVARTPMDVYIERYRSARKKTARGK